MEKEEDTTSRLEEAREARVFPLFRLSMDFFASPSVYTPGAFLPSISAVFFPIFFFVSSSRPSFHHHVVCSSIRSNFRLPFSVRRSPERNFRWLIILFRFASKELLDDYRYVRSSVEEILPLARLFLFCNIIF